MTIVAEPTLDLGKVVDSLLDESEADSPKEIAEQVLRDLPDSLLRPALAEALPQFVSKRIHFARMRTTTAGQEGWGQSAGENPEKPRPASSSARSWVVEGVRETWKRHLADRYHVAGEWMRLADMSPVELTAAADERYDIAEKNQNAANRFVFWADLVERHGVGTFGELPHDVLERELTK